MDYENMTSVFKAIAEPNRVKIIDLLSFKSMCACDVLAHFDFTQPTLSHHMKVLEASGIVSVNKQCKWHYYSLNHAFVKEFMASMDDLFSIKKQE